MLPKVARTLMQQRSQPFTPLFVEDLIGRMWTRGFGLQRGQSSLVKIVDRIANRLIATADETGNGGRRFALGAGQQHLTTADGEALRGPTTCFELRLLLFREGSDKQWCLHSSSFYHMPKHLVLTCTSNPANCRTLSIKYSPREKTGPTLD